MTPNLEIALAIVAALEELRSVEPFITRLVDGSIVAIWMDDLGELKQRCIYPSETAPRVEAASDSSGFQPVRSIQ